MSRHRPPATAQLPRCVLDSGGLSALCGGSMRAKFWLRWMAIHMGRIVIPTPILVECTTGSGARDAEVNRIMAKLEVGGVAIVAPDEETARRAGRLRYAARCDDGIDALVAAVAVGDGSPAVVLTSDPRDLERLMVNDRNVSVRKV